MPWVFSCGKQFYKYLCLSVCLSVHLYVSPSVCPSVPAFVPEQASSLITMIFYHMIKNTYHLWFPNSQGHLPNFKVTEAKKIVRWVKFRVSRHFLENECMGVMSWNLACWCILTTFKSNYSLVMVCWFSSFWWQWNRSNVGVLCILWRMHGRNGLKFGMQMYPNHLQNWLDLIIIVYLLIFLICVMSAP